MQNIFLTILSGILVGTSYIPFQPWALAFAFVPLFIVWLRDPRPQRVFFYGWLTQFIYTLIGFHWIAGTAIEFGHLHWTLGVLAVLLFASFANLHLAIAGFIWAFINKRAKFADFSSLLFFSLVYFISNDLWPTIFPSNFGYTLLWANLPAYHWADILGFEGLGLLVLFCNIAFYFLWKWRDQKTVVLQRMFYLFLLIFIFNYAGYIHGKLWSTFDAHVNIAVIQANIGNYERAYAERGAGYQDLIVTKNLDLAAQELAKTPGIDLVTIPETGFPITLDPTFFLRPLSTKVLDFIKTHKVAFLAGAYSDDSQPGKTYNAIFSINKDGVITQSYRKTLLLAFGEYLPGAKIFPGLKKLLPFVSDFGEGSGPMSISAANLTIGPQICYEGLYPWFSRELVRNKAEIFFNATNDSWFGFTFEPYQHLYMTFARAIEFRRPLVRATNTGISSVILADGSILDQSPIHEEWTHTFDVSYKKNPEMTFFANFGGFFIYLAGLALVLIFILGRDHEES